MKYNKIGVQITSPNGSFLENRSQSVTSIIRVFLVTSARGIFSKYNNENEKSI